jgi:hypothetical protein
VDQINAINVKRNLIEIGRRYLKRVIKIVTRLMGKIE